MRHIVKSFDRDLSQLDDHGRQDGAPGSQEHTVGAMRNAIHRYAVRLLALRTPFAGDLRQVVSALLISSDLERIAGHLKNIAERTAGIGHPGADRARAGGLIRRPCRYSGRS